MQGRRGRSPEWGSATGRGTPAWSCFPARCATGIEFDLPAAADRLDLDLGAVGDIAEALLDGEPAGVRMWAPYRTPLTAPVAAGRHTLEVRVSNSMANAYEGAQLPSGLIGPVQLIIRQRC